MTNGDVLRMVQGKIAEDIILNAIRDAQTKSFDLSAAGLIELKSAGVSDAIIRVMQGRPQEAAPTTTSLRAAESPAQPGRDHAASAGEPQKGGWRLLNRMGVKKVPESEPVATAADDGVAPAQPVPTEAARSKATPSKATRATSASISNTNGGPAMFVTALTPDAACARVRQYFVSNDVELETSDCAAGQLRTRPVNRAGLLVDKAKRAVVSFVSSSNGTEVRVRVMVKGSGFFSINGNAQDSEKLEGTDRKSSTSVAAELQRYLEGA